MRPLTLALGAILLLAGCGHPAQRPVAKPAATLDPEIRSLRAQLVQARAERDAALARLRALQHKPAVVRVVVREPAAAGPRPAASTQPATQIFTTVTTAASP